MGRTLDLAIAALNGLLGDYLARTGNGLTFPLEFVDGGLPVTMTRSGILAACPTPSARVVVLVHGMMCTEDIFRMPDGSDYGRLLARDLGFTPLYIRYNSGLPIPDNGAMLDGILEELVAAYPVPIEELVLLGYSMGGLVVRSACHAAVAKEHTWLSRVRRAIYVGTPHRGAPLERAGRVFTKVMATIPDPVTRLIADIGDLRSDGIKDLGDADVRHEDRARRTPTMGLRDPRHPVPLLASIQHYLIAGALDASPWVIALFGDSLVPIHSATYDTCKDTASAAFAPGHVRFLPGIAHVRLAHAPEVYAHIRSFCEEVPS